MVRMAACDTQNNYMRLIDTSNNTTTLYGTPSSVWPTGCCQCNPALYAGWIEMNGWKHEHQRLVP